LTDHQKGLLLVSLGVVVIIPDATLIRLIDAPSLTTAMWRTGLTSLSIFAYLGFRYGTRLPDAIRAIGRWGVVSSALSGMGTILFVLAVDNTSVANVVLILALTPLWAAMITRLARGTPIPRRTIAAMPFAFVGVAIAVGGSLDGALNAGDGYALWASFGLALNMTIIRARSHVDMVPTTGIGGVMGFVTLAAIGTSTELTPGDLPPLLVLGLVVMPGAMGLMTAGGRHLASSETTLLILGETALSPVLAAIAVDEPLGAAALTGGALVLITLFLHGWLGLRENAPAKMPA